MEVELKSRPNVLEKEPSWVAGLKRLEKTLIIPSACRIVPTEKASANFQDMNIIAEEPLVMFV